MEELLKICEQGSVQEIQEFCSIESHLISSRQGLNAALQVAAANGNDHVMEFLLGIGADLNSANAYGWTPLMQASRHGHTATVLLLLEQGAEPNARNRFGVNALTCAVRSGHVATVCAILDCGEQWAESDREARVDVTPVIVAAELGHDPILRLLLDADFNVNHASHITGVTPLMMAAANGHTRTATILIERGANIVAMTRSGKTALDVAVAKKRSHVRCFLEQQILELSSLEAVPKEFDIFEAIQSGGLDEVRAFLSKKATIATECRQTNGVTPLMLAAQIGDSETVELLLKVGAQLDSTDTSNGWTALMFALLKGHNQIALRLIQAGANVNVCALGGLVAFDIALVIGSVNPDVITLLAKKTNEEFLHPLSNILRQDEPCVRSSRSRNVYTSLGRTLGRFWFPKFQRYMKSGADLSVDENSSPNRRPVDLVSSMPLNFKENSYDSGAFMSSSFSDSSSGSIEKAFLPSISESLCRSAISKSPVRPALPLLPSVGLDTSMAAANFNMCLNLPSAFANLKKSPPQTATSTANLVVNRKSSETDKSLECQEDELYAVLKNHSLDHYKFVFDKEEVDVNLFKMLTDKDLVNLNIEDTSIRNRLLRVIAELNDKREIFETS